MSVEIVNPPSLASPRGYSHGMLGPAGGRLLTVAGQIAWDGDGRLVGDGFAEQFHQALTNVVAVVVAAGGAVADLAQLTLYVTDKRDYEAALDAVGSSYRDVMGRHFPAMALVEVAGLLEPGAKVEIQALALLPADAVPADATPDATPAVAGENR